jgi:hypothetical protein
VLLCIDVLGGYNFRELTAQHEKCNAPSAKDKCDTRSLVLILKIGAFDCIGRFLPYLNREGETRREAREGAVHPKIASPTASLRWAVTAASHAQLVTMVPIWRTSVSMIPMF